MNAELMARVAAAAAVLADFLRARDQTDDDVVTTGVWADRLAGMLQSVLELAELFAVQPVADDGDAGARLQQIRDIFEVFDWSTDDRQYALEQIEEIAVRGTL